MSQRRSFITGGAGFIGSNLADTLLRRGEPVTVFDDLSRRGADWNLAWLEARHGDRLRFVRGDIRDFEALAAALDGAAVVYHLAGQTAVTRSVADPRHDFEQNALGTLNVLEAARRLPRPPIVVYASTNKVYGGLEHLPVAEAPTRWTFPTLPDGVAEDQPLDFHSPYGCSKGAADQYVRDYHRIYGLPTVVFRQSCIYGPRQMGIEDQGWVGWFLIATELGRPLTIFGDGKQVRDLLYVDDLIAAYLAAVERIDVAAGQIYNVGGGLANTLSVWHEFRPLLERAAGRPLPEPRREAWRPGDQRVFYCDLGKARLELDWTPRVSLEAGIGRLAGWVRDERAFFAGRF